MKRLQEVKTEQVKALKEGKERERRLAVQVAELTRNLKREKFDVRKEKSLNFR